MGKIMYYSERGMVNHLINYMASKNERAKNILEKIKLLNGKTLINSDSIIFDVVLYDEFSLGDFGSPDLVIEFSEKNGDKTFRKVVFVEAKKESYAKSKSKNKKYENNASCIDVQMNLKMRLFYDKNIEYNNNSIYCKEIGENDFYIRKLGKNSLIDWISKIHKDFNEKNYQYILYH